MSEKVAAIMAVKNESAIMAHSLDVLSLLVDDIVVLDDNSQDNTREIARDYNNVTLIESKERVRNEGRDFQIALNSAVELGAKRIYISDPDEIVPPHQIDNMKSILMINGITARIIRSEVCCDQKSIYGQSGTGKAVIYSTDQLSFNTDQILHSSQPASPHAQTCLHPEYCTLLHWGQSDKAYTIFKLLFYMVIEHYSIDKPYKNGYNEYFHTYENFVDSTDTPIDRYLWNGENGIHSPAKYIHWLPENIREFCEKLGTEFDPDETIEKFLKIDGVFQLVEERVKN